jgi:hypothetical protein
MMPSDDPKQPPLFSFPPALPSAGEHGRKANCLMNVCSLKLPLYRRNKAFGFTVFSWAATRGLNMRKLSLAFAAWATIAVAAPTMATAEEFGVGVPVGGDHLHDRGEFRGREELRGARAEFRDHDRGWHRGWGSGRGDRTVIIKRRHHDWD